MAVNNGTSWPRNGFTLDRRANAAEQFVRNYPALADADQPIAIGDAVTILNGVVRVASAGMDPARPGWGIVIDVMTTANRPFTEQQVKIITSGNTGRVDVLYDPFQAEFIVRCEASVGIADLTKNFQLIASGANATLGRSSQSVTIQASASPDNLFKGVGRYAEVNDITGTNGFKDSGGAGQGIVVRWNRHVLKAGTAGV